MTPTSDRTMAVKPGEALAIVLAAALIALVVGILAFDAGYDEGRCEEYAAARGLTVVEVNRHDGSCVGYVIVPPPKPIRFTPAAAGGRLTPEPESQESP